LEITHQRRARGDVTKAQPVAAQRMARRSLAARLRNNESVLLAAYRDIAATVGAGRAITPAAEWLLDNYHLVEEQIRKVVPTDRVERSNQRS
jgi:hypothetical protein